MHSLFEPSRVTEIKERIARLHPDSQRLWGTMDPAQAAAHCALSLETAVGDRKPPRMFLGYLLGWVIKPLALGDDAPMRKNTPTVAGHAVVGARDFTTERTRLLALIDRFVDAGPSGVTTHPHGFFGYLTPDQWGVLQYKHLDHHLRQFGV